MKKISVLLLVGWGVVLYANANAIPAREFNPENLIAEWQTLAAGGVKVESLIKGYSESAPVTDLGGGVVSLPVQFEGSHIERANWDIPVKLDMNRATGVTFDFYCADISCFSSFSIYLRADGRWLHGMFAPETNGEWSRIRVLKTAFKEDSTNSRISSFRQVDCIRISGWRAKDVDTICALANMAIIPVDPDVLVIRGVSSATDKKNESEYILFASNLEKTLKKLDVDYISVDDRELIADDFKGVAVAALAYSKTLPPNVLPLLEDFTLRGGKLMCFYAVPSGVTKLLGVKHGDWVKPVKGTFSGFSKAGQGVPHQPQFAPQASWNAQIYNPDAAADKNSRVVASWCDAEGEDTGYPAVVVSDSGAVFGHVWLADDHQSSAELMMSVLGAIAPSLWQRRAQRVLRQIGKFDDTEDFAEFEMLFKDRSVNQKSREFYQQCVVKRGKAENAVANNNWIDALNSGREAIDLALKARCALFEPVKNEHRAFWCHSAFGLKNKSWDESVKFLKEHGFNVLLPNMSWGAAASYPSEVLPVHSSVKEQGDQIQQCLAACRKYGVECHVWKVCWKTGYRITPEFEKQLRQEGRLQQAADGSSDDLWLCPSHPENRRMEIEAQLEVVRNYDVDGVHFDYIRYPGSSHCFCPGCRERFEKQVGEKINDWPRDVRRGGAFYEQYLGFRRDNITRVVRSVSEKARAIRPDIKISAAVFRSAPTDRDSIGQDWQMWCEQGWLDFVCPMNYLDSTLVFKNLIIRQQEFVGKVPLYPGIGLSCWKDESSHPLKLCRQISAVREVGLRGFTVFNFDAHAENALPYVSLGATRATE